MKKRIVTFILSLICVFSISSCAVIPAYDSTDLVEILVDEGYEVENIDEKVYEGITGYIHGANESTGDEIYYIYCENIRSAKSVYDYVNSQQKARIAELKMEIEKIDYALNKSEGISAAEKGDYYEQYVIKTEELEEVQSFTCGHALNVVWYGTKSAVMTIRKG